MVGNLIKNGRHRALLSDVILQSECQLLELELIHLNPDEVVTSIRVLYLKYPNASNGPFARA